MNELNRLCSHLYLSVLGSLGHKNIPVDQWLKSEAHDDGWPEYEEAEFELKSNSPFNGYHVQKR